MESHSFALSVAPLTAQCARDRGGVPAVVRLALALVALGLSAPDTSVRAATALVRSVAAINNSGDITLSLQPAAGNLVVVIIGTARPPLPTGDPLAGPVPSSGAPWRKAIGARKTCDADLNCIGQAIFYKVANAAEDTQIRFKGPSVGVQYYEFSGLFVDGVPLVAAAAQGADTGLAVSSGVLSAAANGDLLVAGFALQGETTLGSLTNAFVKHTESTSLRMSIAGGVLLNGIPAATSTGSVASAATSWMGQIVAFRRFASGPPLAHLTTIAAADVTELRGYIDTARAAHALGAFSWTESNLAPGTIVKAVHLREMWNALGEVYQSTNRVAPTPTTELPGPGITVKAAHVLELRAAVEVMARW
jgi:hypothetical protein